MYDEYIKIINKNNGIITAKKAVENGISRTMLKKMADRGVIKRIEYGIYVTDKFVNDEFYIFQLKHPNIIFSYNTALFIHGMTERTPHEMDVTIVSNNSLNYCKEKIKVHRVSKNILDIGKTTAKTCTGMVVNVYNLERTVCDLINNRTTMDIETSNKAIKKCINLKGFRVSTMFEYAKKMKIYDKVELYMEAII